MLQALSALPVFAVYLVAGILAVTRWDKHPTTSLLVITSAGIAVIARVAMFAMPMVLMRDGGDSATVMQWGYTVAGLASTVALGCLVAAVFSERDRKDGPPSQFR